jgi:hypothetical protein
MCGSLKDPKRKHNNFTKVVYRGDPIHGCDLSFTSGVRAQQDAMAAHASPGGRPPPSRVGAPHGRGKRIARLHHSSRLERVPLRTYTSSSKGRAVGNKDRAFLKVLTDTFIRAARMQPPNVANYKINTV